MPTVSPIVGTQSLRSQSTPSIPVFKPVAKPVPEIPQFGMWIGFLYIIYFIALYAWATSFGNILHEIVNRYLQDALELEEASRSYMSFWSRDYVIRWSLSALIIFYPVFAFTHLLVQRYLTSRPETVNIRVRKILIYITLIGTLLIACWQLAKFVYTYLNGTVTLKTFVHFGVTLSIASLIFIYYFLQIKRDKNL